MNKPTEIELKTALVAATTMEEHNKDPFYIAKTLLNHDYRLKHFEELLKAADLYINHGHTDREHMALVQCIEKLNEPENHKQDDDT